VRKWAGVFRNGRVHKQGTVRKTVFTDWAHLNAKSFDIFSVAEIHGALVPHVDLASMHVTHCWAAGALFLLAFFVWGSLNLGSTSAGKRAAGLWGSVVAYSAVLTAARSGVQLAFAVGKSSWVGGGLSEEILGLIGFAKAPNALQIILVPPPPPRHYKRLSDNATSPLHHFQLRKQ
jgi:hypothetical protein